MAYFNTNDASFYSTNTNGTSFYSTSSASGELGAYPVLSLTSATEETNTGTTSTFTDYWSEEGQPSYIIGEPTCLRAEASFGKYDCGPFDDHGLTCTSPESATSYGAQTRDQDHPGHYWPTTDWYAQSYPSGIGSRDNSFASMAVSEAPAVIPTPSSSKCIFSPTRLWGIECSSTANSPVRLLGSQ